MATVFHSHRRYRIVVNSNDHLPAHVHSFGKGCEARFKLNCPEGPVEFWDFVGDWTLAHLNELGREIAVELDRCCRDWSEIHG